MRLETKTVAARVTDAKADGTATALVSVFGNVDLGGDRVMPGAFTRSLEEWQAKGDPIPVIWSHDWDNPESFVGWAEPKDITETDAGLVVPMKFDLDRSRAEQVHHLLKTRRVTQFSFGYFAREYADVEDADYGTVRELTDIELFEVGPTLLGMNPETELIQAASALRGMKDHRILSSKDQGQIRAAYDALGSLLETIDAPKDSATEELAEADQKAVDVPSYVSENAARGIALYEEGRGGDGLVEQTIRDARDMIAGEIRDEKVRLMGPWIARHIVDLEAPQNSDPDADGYPGAGLVAMLLWGAGPDVEGARRTQEWAEQTAASLDEDDASTNGVKTPEDSPADAGDTQGTIPSEHITALLTRPRNTEE